MKLSQSRQVAYIVLVIMFLANLIALWPGQMTQDSHAQYKIALEGVYEDAHPPMMSIVWKYLDKLHKGSGLLMFFHLAMLYSAAAIFIQCVPINYSWFYVILPIIPPISFYSSMIWKDIGFAASYLLLLALISFSIIHAKKPSGLQLIFMLIILFYGSTVKFQGIYTLPVALLGICCCYTNFKFSPKTFLYTTISYIIFMIAITLFHDYYVTNKRHFWQFVKIYDIAGISMLSNTDLFPPFMHEYPPYSFDKVKKLFNYERVDDLIFFNNPPLVQANNEIERELVLEYWKRAIYKHPWHYFKHRFNNWKRMINIMPIERLDRLDFSGYSGLSWFTHMQKNSQEPLSNFPEWNPWFMALISKILFKLFEIMRHALRTIFLLPFLLLYFFTGIKRYQLHKAAIPLILLSSVSISILLAMFFFSMASSIRYIYIMICMIHASHGFGYWCIKDWILGKKTLK